MNTRSPPSKVRFRKFTLNNLKKYYLIKKLNLKHLSKIEIPADQHIGPKKPFLLEFSQFLLKYKAYHALDFTNGLTVFRTMRINKQILMIKRQSRIKKLIIPLGFYFRVLDIKRMILWVRYTKSLKELDCTVPKYLYNIVENVSNNLLLWKTIKRTRLEVLNVNSTSYAGTLINFLPKLNYVPSTVKGFHLKHALQEVDSIESISKMNLSSLKHLNKLSLSLYPNVKVWESLLTSIPNPNQLVKLHLDIPRSLSKDFTFSCFTLQENNQVRILELTFMEAPKDINIFVKAFQCNKLKTLKVSINKIVLTPRKNWVWIVDLLDNNPGLEKIKIGLMYPVNDTNAEDKFYKSLIKAISKLKYLKKLKLSLNDFDPNSAVGNAFSIQELYKLKNIEEISFESNCMVSQMWDDFIDLSQYFGSTLKKLKLDLGKTTPDMSYLKQLRSFIRSLTTIEVLELEGFEIPSIKFWKEFIKCLTGLKNLRKLEVGNRHLKKIELDHEILPILLSLPFLQRLKYCADNVLRIENQVVRKQIVSDFKKRLY